MTIRHPEECEAVLQRGDHALSFDFDCRADIDAARGGAIPEVQGGVERFQFHRFLSAFHHQWSQIAPWLFLQADELQPDA